MAKDQKALASRAAGKPAFLSVGVGGTDGDTTLTVDGIKFGDVVVGVVEFNAPSASTGNAIRSVRSGTVTGNGTVTVGGGSALTPGDSALVLYYDFTP